MKCKQTEELVRQVVAQTGTEATVEKVSDVQAIVTAGVMSTPAVAVDGLVKLSGRVPTADELRRWIAG
jgi:small redox-active disulfide protein 2